MRSLIDRLRQPLPVWSLLTLVYAALVAAHAGLLNLPYYWDEAGYYIPAAWDFFRTGSLIPHSTLTNAHPPLPSLWLAAGWKLFGFSPLVTRLSALLAAALALVAVERLARQLTSNIAISYATLLLTALYPVWFAQSSLAHADIFAAACSLWGLAYWLPSAARRPWPAAACFALAALAKETSIITPATLGLLSLIGFCLSREERRTRVHEMLSLVASVIPLACWYGYHKHATGFVFGNPEFLRYNAQANLEPARIAAAFVHRLLHLTAHMNLFVPVALAAGSFLLELRRDAPAYIRRSSLVAVLALIISNAVFFSILGGALLTRYLLPVYPLVLVLALAFLANHMRRWWLPVAFSAVSFVAGLFVNPPYGFAPEDNLAYASMIRLEQQAIGELERRNPGAVVLTAWPVSDALTKPELGYVQQPFTVFPVDDFSQPQMDAARHQPERYSEALVFSTKYDPQSPLFTLGKRSQQMDAAWFGLHHDLSPVQIARLLGGQLEWERHANGQWAALIRFHRQWDARVEPLSRLR